MDSTPVIEKEIIIPDKPVIPNPKFELVFVDKETGPLPDINRKPSADSIVIIRKNPA